MLDKSCFCSRETRLFWVWRDGGLNGWSGAYTVLRASPTVKSFRQCGPSLTPLLSPEGFYLPISSSRARPSGRLNGAMFPVSQIFKWKPTMKVWLLRAGSLCHVLALSSQSQMQRPKPQPRAPDKPGEGESICKFNIPHQVLNLFTLQI